jgi:hypothetical protein
VAGLTRENGLRAAWILGVAAALALIFAQFLDYTGFRIGSGGVESANEVAPRPIGLRAGVGGDQLWLGIPLGIGALLALRLVARGQWRLGRAVALAGGVGVALTLLILLPNATDGSAGGDAPAQASAYAGSEERILGGFWTQLAASLSLTGSGLALARLGSRT